MPKRLTVKRLLSIKFVEYVRSSFGLNRSVITEGAYSRKLTFKMQSKIVYDNIIVAMIGAFSLWEMLPLRHTPNRQLDFSRAIGDLKISRSDRISHAGSCVEIYTG